MLESSTPLQANVEEVVCRYLFPEFQLRITGPHLRHGQLEQSTSCMMCLVVPSLQFSYPYVHNRSGDPAFFSAELGGGGGGGESSYRLLCGLVC